MTCTAKVKSFIFSHEDAKKAYMMGCKKVAKYISKPERPANLTFSVERTKDEIPTFIFTVFAKIDMGEAQRTYCKICKEMHSSFFVNEEYNCSRCNLKAYLHRVKQSSNVSKGYYKKLIED